MTLKESKTSLKSPETVKSLAGNKVALQSGKQVGRLQILTSHFILLDQILQSHPKVSTIISGVISIFFLTPLPTDHKNLL